MTAAERRLFIPFLREVAGCAVRPLSLSALSLLKRYAEKRKPKSPRKIEKEQERLLKKGARADVRAACVERAKGKCEACGVPADFSPLEFDHFYGRRWESLETCWMIGRGCHKDKTENYPTREAWDILFKAHCQKYGYPFRKRFTKTIARHPQQEEATSDMESAGRGLAGTSTESK